jgi:hypothetical protein
MPLGQAMSSTASHGSRATVVGVSLTEPAILTPATWLGRAARASSGRRWTGSASRTPSVGK